ncbi:hypothetical protein SLNWT_0132 [Streptomyces albus]|uniref:Uncharacterized protein n=1 Tax=Streptomyces albus (strain ATCC 21838 / DSM 41398 / FERM P-419 / JCM 4703 / NBRC 107858) TaxID=1081613 RepID=A0A0B5EEW5_STRA4|nr:hypothetical protein SLNWT_0132 [Streptomyces albus]AOU74827.1 hypothetical protein SLNHY_0136 [Streptomyces albus]
MRSCALRRPPQSSPAGSSLIDTQEGRLLLPAREDEVAD